MSGEEVAKEELKEIDICDICSEEESGVFLNSGASYLDGFSAFHKWVSKGRSVSDGNCECAKTTLISPCKCAKVPPGAAAGEIRMDRGGGLYEAGVYSDEEDPRASRASSIVDCLLVELYDTYSNNFRGVDSSTEASSSDAFLGRSNTGSNFLQELQEKHTRRHQMKYLDQKGEHHFLSRIKSVTFDSNCQIILIYVNHILHSCCIHYAVIYTIYWICTIFLILKNTAFVSLISKILKSEWYSNLNYSLLLVVHVPYVCAIWSSMEGSFCIYFVTFLFLVHLIFAVHLHLEWHCS